VQMILQPFPIGRAVRQHPRTGRTRAAERVWARAGRGVQPEAEQGTEAAKVSRLREGDPDHPPDRTRTDGSAAVARQAGHWAGSCFLK
jgi:hypothetical protein